MAAGSLWLGRNACKDQLLCEPSLILSMLVVVVAGDVSGLTAPPELLGGVEACSADSSLLHSAASLLLYASGSSSRSRFIAENVDANIQPLNAGLASDGGNNVGHEDDQGEGQDGRKTMVAAG